MYAHVHPSCVWHVYGMHRCADYGVEAGYNDNFPMRAGGRGGGAGAGGGGAYAKHEEQINPEDGGAPGVVRFTTANEFMC